MPLNLPGFYWDENKNRYFPESSRPKAPPSPQIKSPRSLYLSSTRSPNLPSKCGKERNLGLPLNLCAQLRRRPYREKDAHEILSTHYATTSHLTHSHVPTFGRITAFCSTTLNDQCRRFIGDDQGWIYSCSTPDDPDHCDALQYWMAEQNLQPSSEISSICISGSRRVATCFGQSSCAKISVHDLDSIGMSYLLGLKNCHDIWTSSLQDKTLVLGANEKAVYLSDIETAPPIRFLTTHSDVFSLVQKDSLVYTGARNGSIDRFDMRTETTFGQKLFNDRFRNQQRSSVLHLEIIKDTQLLVSQMNGLLATYDMRFSRGTPTVTFEGHHNTYIRRLGLSVDHDQDFLFAAGEDCRIRGWSLRSGASLYPPPFPVPSTIIPPNVTIEKTAQDNPFLAVFDSPIVAMQTTNEKGLTSLWAASDEDLYRYHLGQRKTWV